MNARGSIRLMITLLQLIICITLLIAGLRKRVLTGEFFVIASIFIFVIMGCEWVDVTGSYVTSGGGIPPITLQPNQAEKVGTIFFNVTINICLI